VMVVVVVAADASMVLLSWTDDRHEINRIATKLVIFCDLPTIRMIENQELPDFLRLVIACYSKTMLPSIVLLPVVAGRTNILKCLSL